ncbi:MAG: hypothetical protein JWL59_519 [Chthoniobacteraceae bacterium]|nr:hypothetical protein [Chthoniobacteraceae bacterium]
MTDPQNADNTQPATDAGKRKFPAPDPNLSATLRADYEALLNDVKQANELATDYQRQLAVKSNELALSTQLFERTQKHLTDLNAGIAELRRERHQLANEAMRSDILERRLGEVTVERDQLRSELALLKARASLPSDTALQFSSECDVMVDKLILKVESLTKLLRGARRLPGVPPVAGGEAAKSAAPAARGADSETITIHFGS